MVLLTEQSVFEKWMKEEKFMTVPAAIQFMLKHLATGTCQTVA